jgi:hypothetical protein
MEQLLNLVKNKYVLGGGLLALIVVIILLLTHKSNFKSTLYTPYQQFNQEDQPMSLGKINAPDQDIPLLPPDVPEEIGLAMVYPQGDGVGMDPDDSNSFYPYNPGSLLSDHTTAESIGESSLTDPTGNTGSMEGARILKIKNTGNQMQFKPIDENVNSVYAAAYRKGEVQDSKSTLINGGIPINYNDGFDPEDNLKLQASPGHFSSLPNCESTYPNVVKYNGMCITEGDIPYGQVVDNKVNPRLVSRWESFTGDYSRNLALDPIDGVLYPNLNVLVK